MLMIFSLAMIWLLISDQWLVVKALGCVWIMMQLCYLYHNPQPHPNLVTLTGHNGADAHWILRDKHGKEQIFMRHKCLIETGIFFLLELSSDTDQPSSTKLTSKVAKQTIVIFFDQLTTNEYRLLRIWETCEP